MDVADSSVNGSRIGNRRWPFICCRSGSGSDALFLSSRPFIEYIAIAGFSISVIAIQ